MKYQTLTAAFALAVLASTSSCAPKPTKPGGTVFTVTYEDMHCPFNEGRQQTLHSRQQVESLFGTEAGLKTSIGAAPKAALPDKLRAALANAHFDKETWILVAWGTQPNPGYRPVVTNEQAHYVDGTLQLPVTLKPPAAGKMYSQVIVTPCQLLSVQLHEPIRQIELQ
jgi:hypothetical protein